MAPTTECIIGIDGLSMYVPASLCPQALTGIAVVRAILVGVWKTVNLPDSWAIAKGLTFDQAPSKPQTDI